MIGFKNHSKQKEIPDYGQMVHEKFLNYESTISHLHDEIDKRQRKIEELENAHICPHCGERYE